MMRVLTLRYMTPRLTLIAAIDQQRLLATDKRIPWRLPRDIAFFREYTANKWLILGRKTYGQMRGWFKEGHKPLILTSSPTLELVQGQKVRTLREALTIAKDAGAEEVVCCGGAQVYAECLPLADTLILTLIHNTFPTGENPVYFPEYQNLGWQEIRREYHAADENNAYAMEFVTYTATKANEQSSTTATNATV